MNKDELCLCKNSQLARSDEFYVSQTKCTDQKMILSCQALKYNIHLRNAQSDFLNLVRHEIKSKMCYIQVETLLHTQQSSMKKYNEIYKLQVSPLNLTIFALYLKSGEVLIRPPPRISLKMRVQFYNEEQSTKCQLTK